MVYVYQTQFYRSTTRTQTWINAKSIKLMVTYKAKIIIGDYSEIRFMSGIKIWNWQVVIFAYKMITTRTEEFELWLTFFFDSIYQSDIA